jgi:hypothetical protein
VDLDGGQRAGDAHRIGSDKKPLAANVWLDRNDAVEQRVWAPGEAQIIENRLVA